MWQLMQSDEYVNNIMAKDSTRKNNNERMKIYRQVFDLNKTSMEEFKKSYGFYMAHPDITKTMFDSITAKATRQRTEFYKPKTDSVTGKESMMRIQVEKRRADSLAKAVAQNKIQPAKKDTAAKKQVKLRKPRHGKLKLHSPKP